jgi:hypothetical protein
MKKKYQPALLQGRVKEKIYISAFKLMKSRNVLFTLCLLLVVIVVFIARMRREPRPGELFDRTPMHLEYTRHALCRMNCRHISKQDIENIMKKGVINLSRSNRNDKPCPSFALQGRTPDGENLRVVFAQCNEETRVVTCYNLEKEFTCDCAGDENKRRN